MATLTIRLPKQLARALRISVNKLSEQLSTIALAEFDTQNRFLTMKSRGNTEEGLKILAKLDTLTQ